ncbi:MAG TPA: hypothetical protein P5316_12435 [Phycisphaerae bacterium]|nr:hypothetical protein [Phycisphaerae bacterium]
MDGCLFLKVSVCALVLVLATGANTAPAASAPSLPAAAGQPAGVPAEPTCAVLAEATAGLDSSPVVALLETKLSQDSRVRLVERAEITRILAEHSLSLSLAESTPKSRREWGQVLRAQMLVLLQTRQVKEGKVIEAGFVETRHGLSLGSERLVWDDRAEQIASLLARRTSQVAGTLGAGVKHVFAVPPFEAEDLSPDSLQYQSAYAQLVEETLSHLPGVVMADLAHAAEVARELAVSEGETSVARSLPYYLHGRHKMTGPTGNRTVSFHLELRHGQETIASIDKEAIHPDSAASFLRESCTELARKVSGGARQAPVNGATALEADLLEERCKAYRLVGEWESSIRMAEAALLLDPGRHELRAMAIDSYEQMVSVWQKRRSQWEEDFRAEQNANARKGIATRPYDINAGPVPLRDFIQCGFTAINHARHLSRTRSLAGDELWPLMRLLTIVSGRYPYRSAYDWKQDPSTLKPLMRNLSDRYLDLVLHLLCSDRVGGKGAQENREQLLVDGCLMACSPDWATQEEQLGIIRRIILATESLDDSFAIQYRTLELNRRVFWQPEATRQQFLGELAARQEGKTRFVVECLLAMLRDQDTDQGIDIRQEVDAIARRAFPGQPIPPPQMWAVYERFRSVPEFLRQGEQRRPNRVDMSAVGSKDDKIWFAAISDSDPRFCSPYPLRVNGQWLALDDRRDAFVYGGLNVMTGPWQRKNLGTFEKWAPARGDFAWDGQYLWVADMRARTCLQVLDGISWESVAVIGEPDGFPDMKEGCKIAPLAPGRVCVVGCTGEQLRIQSWIATIELSGDAKKGLHKSVDVFHSARQVLPARGKASTQPSGAERGFQPVFAVPVPSGRSQTPLVLVGRRNWGEGPPGGAPALLVDPATRQVTILPEKWGSDWTYVVGPDRVYVLTYREVHMPLVPIVAAARLPDTELREVIALDKPCWEFVAPTTAVVEGNLLHAIGKEWFTVDLSVPQLVRKSPLDKKILGCRLTRSSLYGLVAYSSEGAWQVTFGEDQAPTGPAVPIGSNRLIESLSDGALVSWLPNPGRYSPGSQAVDLKIGIGDVIVAVNNQKISSASDFYKISADIENKQRTIEVIGQTGRRTVTAQPGKIGIFLCDYKASYGSVLTAALRACRDGRYGQARRLFEDAVAAGLEYRSAALLPLIYAHCVYYSGDVAEALSILDECVSQLAAEPKRVPWVDYLAAFDPSKLSPGQNTDGYLGLYLLQQTARKYPEHIPTLGELSRYQQRVLHRYPEAVSAWLDLIEKARTSGNSGLACAVFDYLLPALSTLKMGTETSAACRYLVDAEFTVSCSTGLLKPYSLAEFLLDAGEPDSAIRLWLRTKAQSGKPIYPNWRHQRIIGALALDGQLDEARSLIRRFKPESDPATEAMMIGWRDLAGDYAKYARDLLARSPRDPWTHDGAFTVLSHLPRPDLAELTQIHDRAVALAKAVPESDKVRFLARIRSMSLGLLMLQGDYDAALSLLSSTASRGDASYVASQREAALFLRDRAVNLTETPTPFVGTQYALRVPSGGWLLLTRDNRMGWARPDTLEISEIPLPDRAWTPIHGYSFDHDHRGDQDPDISGNIMCSDSGKTVVVLGDNRTAYVLNADRRSWARLIRFRVGEECEEGNDVHRSWLRRIRPVLDEFAEFMLAKAESVRDVVWFPGSSHDRAVRVMLCDGTWMVHNQNDSRRFVDLSQLCARALGGPVEIYEISDPEIEGPTYLYTSHGVLKWLQRKDQIEVLPFPDRTKPAAIFPLINDTETATLASLPDAGGAIYRFDLVYEKLTRDAGINQCYPMTYWLQKPVEWNRQQVIDAVTKAGLPWPPPWLPIQTAESQPARR